MMHPFPLDQAYNRSDFQRFMRSFMDDYREQEQELRFAYQTNFATSAYRLGMCEELGLEVFEIHHSSPKDARIGTAQDAFRLLLHESYCNRALVAFVPEQGSQWRFSLLEMEACTDDKTNRITRSYSNARRQSFLLGENGNYQTPKKYLFDMGMVRSVDDLHTRFSVEALTKEFYQQLFAWYQWAVSPQAGVTFPNNTKIEEDDREKIDIKIIRLITRLMFVWFIKQKDLVPNLLFDSEYLKTILCDFDPLATDNGNYYNAILQNLFFATLNRAICDEEGAGRGFATSNRADIKTLYRYAEMFSISETEVINLFSEIPFLNGGLFECLDKNKTQDGVEIAYYNDGFSRNTEQFKDGHYKYRAFVPNNLFFDTERGLFALLNRYNFTIEENTPSEQQVALDPELLGKVFENLLGAYNPETKETARNQSGSFYTPREIVNYMVDESLLAYLGNSDIARSLFSEEFMKDSMHDAEYKTIADKLKKIRILDPACGSGAFPMGLLNRIVDILEKINPDEDAYTLKLRIIENCLYGSDIQPIAAQITKLRFFISLICDCEKKSGEPNFGIPTLPNLETKFVTANSLISLHKNTKYTQLDVFADCADSPINCKKKELHEIRHKHFLAKTAYEKKKLRERDEKLRKELLQLLQQDNIFASKDAKQMASWNPYDQNMVAEFFDPEWMFGVTEGFDVIIGNPPYISTKGVSAEDKKNYEKEFGFSDDTYNLFTWKGLSLTKKGGSLTYIVPKTFWTTQSKRNMRDLLLSKNIRYIFDTANPFESVMVDTCIIQVVNTPYNENQLINFYDGSTDLSNPIMFDPIYQSMYIHTQNAVIFKPTKLNLRIWELYGEKVKMLYDKWWDKIKTSRDIEKNKAELEAYRASLKPGDVALLGCLTKGGQGLATANNGKYIAIRKTSKWAENVYLSRPKKLAEAINKHPEISEYINNLSPIQFLEQSTEQQIAETFDLIKDKFGRDIFGQGYIFRLIDDSEMANVDSLTDDEKENGIDTAKPYYVPYDKGDKDGNRWYLETPFAIAWSKENVHFLKTNSGKKGEGMPVVRNPQFYFKEGFCWNNVLLPTKEESMYIKARIKGVSVNDVASMSMYSLYKNTPNKYIVSLLCSKLFYDYLKAFINNTVNLQINDFRLFPILIPNKNQLNHINDSIDSILSLKQRNVDDSSIDVHLSKYIWELYNI